MLCFLRKQSRRGKRRKKPGLKAPRASWAFFLFCFAAQGRGERGGDVGQRGGAMNWRIGLDGRGREGRREERPRCKTAMRDGFCGRGSVRALPRQGGRLGRQTAVFPSSLPCGWSLKSQIQGSRGGVGVVACGQEAMLTRGGPRFSSKSCRFVYSGRKGESLGRRAGRLSRYAHPPLHELRRVAASLLHAQGPGGSCPASLQPGATERVRWAMPTRRPPTWAPVAVPKGDWVFSDACL